MGELHAIAQSAGLEWVNSDAERIRQNEDELRALLERRKADADALTARHRELDERVRDLSQKVADLTKRLRDEQVILRVLGQRVLPGAPGSSSCASTRNIDAMHNRRPCKARPGWVRSAPA